MNTTEKTRPDHLVDALVDLAAEGERWLAAIDENPGVEQSVEKLDALVDAYVAARSEWERSA
jgi:hypothetical protein